MCSLLVFECIFVYVQAYIRPCMFACMCVCVGVWVCVGVGVCVRERVCGYVIFCT